MASVLTLAGERPPRPVDRELLGLSRDVWMLIQQCWNKDPSTRPQIADILVHFERTYRGWVPPAPDEIANLNLGRTAEHLPSTMESIDTLSEVEAIGGERPADRRRPTEPRTTGKKPVPVRLHVWLLNSGLTPSLFFCTQIYPVFIFCGIICLWVTILNAGSM